MTGLDNRRPLKSRGAGWAKALAAGLARAGVRPDGISAASVVFAMAGAGLFWVSGTAREPRGALLIGAGICVQLRLLCNLLDGMVAVEHGRGGPLGPIWNELPDRFADLLFLVGAGYGAERAGIAGGALLGWTAGALALLTAYVRELGRGLGQPADFSGPMAKPQRMAVLTLGCALSALEPVLAPKGLVLAASLAVISLGAAVTVARRIRSIAGRLKR
jgi:phosphatidylglycerophosphate synthase